MSQEGRIIIECVHERHHGIIDQCDLRLEHFENKFRLSVECTGKRMILQVCDYLYHIRIDSLVVSVVHFQFTLPLVHDIDDVQAAWIH